MLALALLAGSAQAQLWTPADLPSVQLRNWYDADAAGTLWQDADGTSPVTADGQAVLRWDDRSGKGNHLTSVNGPAYMAGVMNSRPVLTFADDSFINPAPAMGNITDNFTVIGVFKVTANSGWDNWIKWGAGTVGDPDVFVVSGGRAGGAAQGMEFGYDGGEGETTDAAVTGTPAFVFIGALDQVPNPDLLSIWQNGISQGSRNPTAAYQSTPSAVLTQFRIGLADEDARNPNGDIAELLVLNTGTGNLATDDQQKLEGYLAHKWWGAGDANPLPAEHPYKSAPPEAGGPGTPPTLNSEPQDALIRANGSATFAVSASGSSPLSYQWRFEGEDLIDMTNSSYTVSFAQEFDAGSYSVVVTNAYGSVTSRVATLTLFAPRGDVIGVNFSTACPDPAADRIDLSETADGLLGWANVAVRSCAGVNTPVGSTPLESGVTLAWSANDVYWDGALTTPDEQLFRVYLDDATSGNVTVSGLANWLAQVTATNAALNGFKVRLYLSANTGTTLLPLEIHEGTPGGALLDTVQPTLPGYGSGVQRGIGDSFPLTNDTIAITWQARPGDLSARSSLAALKIEAVAYTPCVPPTVTSEPQDRTVRLNGNATFSVNANGTAPLSYQWRFEGEEIVGANTNSFTLSLVQEFDTGGYSVVVSNPCGSVTSRVATLSLQPEYAALWTPAQLEPGLLQNWYDADAADTLWQDADGTLPATAHGQMVLRWDDRSGNANHLTSVNGPAYATGAMNSRPVLQFTDSGLARTADLAMGNITDNFTVVGVFKVTGNDVWDNWIRWGVGGDGDMDVFVVGGNRAGGPAQGMEFGYDSGEGETTDTAVTGQPAFLFVGGLDQVADPDLFAVWKDGVSQGAKAATYRTTPSASLSEFRIGHPTSPNRSPNGNIAELLILNTGTSTLSSTDRQKIEGYLAQKWWGPADANPLPADHAYEAAGPSGLIMTVSPEGITVTWPSGTLQSATTLGGDGTPADWADLTTATSPYLVNPTNAASYYRVRR